MKFIKLSLLIVSGLAFLLALWLFLFFRDADQGPGKDEKEVEPEKVKANDQESITTAGV